LLGGVSALLAGWPHLGVAFLLLGIAALLGGVGLLYRPELPRRLMAWLTKLDNLPLTADGNERDLANDEVPHVEIEGSPRTAAARQGPSSP
jgi:hypothetical protein